jgi:hypothetical protein
MLALILISSILEGAIVRLLRIDARLIKRFISPRSPLINGSSSPFGFLLDIGFAVIYDFFHDTDVLVRGLAERSRERHRLLKNVIPGITGSGQEFLCKGIEFGNATGLGFSAEAGQQIGT